MLKEKMLDIMPGALIRFLARPYVAGYSMEKGIRQAEFLLTRTRLSTIDILGEEAKSPADVARALSVYHRLIDQVSANSHFQDRKTRPTVSLKLSALVVAEVMKGSLHLDEDELIGNVRSVLNHARERDVEITIDMEDYHWTDLTLDLYRKFFAEGFASLGTVLQTRLFRTEEDIENLPDRARIRLCIGIYKEASDIAYTDKKEMKEHLLRYSARLLEKQVHLELATHDEHCLNRFFHEVLPRFPYPQDRLEVQMLLGVPRTAIQDRLLSGQLTAGKSVPVRLYVPFAVNAKDATQYSRRRLIANPDMVTYGIKNIIGRFFGRGLY